MQSPEAINRIIQKKYGRFGVNKSREILRLVYEISKRGGITAVETLAGTESADFDRLKAVLLRIRYPESRWKAEKKSFYLPKLEINASEKVKTGIKLKLYPRKVYIEYGSENSPVAGRFKKLFPKAVFKIIPSLKAALRDKEFTPLENTADTSRRSETMLSEGGAAPPSVPSKRSLSLTGLTIRGYNKRSENYFIVKEKYDFFKQCPCTKNAVCCGYNILNIGFGCPYECTYCFLQGYQNFPGIAFPSNLEEYFSGFTEEKAAKGMFGKPRIGTGEFTDSLVFDDITEFSPQIAEFFGKRPHLSFEFKTKSVNIGNLLKKPLPGNIVVSWSLNPQSIIERNEFYTASLEERLNAARAVADAGSCVGFHFDPVIYYPGWEKDYAGVVERLFDAVPGKYINWISIGTLRMNPETKKVIETRFPDNSILDGELLLDFDGKLRYIPEIRLRIYKKMMSWIKMRSNKPFVYLCMEEKDVWKEAGVI
ncbi:MAG: spore photoproduct lyase family protein [Elusimicrobiota bacterium]